MAERIFVTDATLSGNVLTEVMYRIAELVAAAWREEAADHIDSGDYRDHILPWYPLDGDPFAAGALNNTPQADWLEYGRAGFHLPTRISRWPVRASGKQYLRIPFRHFTRAAKGGGASTSRLRGMMPQAIALLTRDLEAGGRLAGFGEAYKRAVSYDYYRQIFRGEGVPATHAYNWAASPFENLTQVGQRRTPGAGTQSEYRTWRTITPESEGWYVPPTAPLHLAENALEKAADGIQQLLDAAVGVDLERQFEGAVEDFT